MTTTQEPKVVIIQQPARHKDLSSAQRYGALHYIFNDPSFQPSEQPGVARRKIEDELKHFDPDQDYLLFLGGDWTGAMIAGHVMRDLYPGREFKTLRWDRERDPSGKRIPGAGFYVPCLYKP